MSQVRVWISVLATLLLLSATAWANLGMLTGEQSGDQFGKAVAAAGDVNGDGLADFLVGAPGGRGAGGVTGTVSLYLGAADSVFEPPALVLEGETAGDEFGYAVATAGDVDNDGYDDFVIGAPGNDGSAFQAGRVYLFAGGASGISFVDSWDGDLSGARFGASVAGGFDFDNDGYDDFAAGAPESNQGATRAGLVKIYLGGSNRNITQPTTYRLIGDQANWALGWSLDAAGDVDDDNYDDLIAGAPQPFDVNAGRAIIWFGQASSSATPSRLVLIGETGFDRFGYSVSGAGDRNQDGYDDVLVGAPGHDSQGIDKGAAYVFLGGFTMNAIIDWTTGGEVAGDSLGYAVDGGTDTDGDDVPDIVIGAPGADNPAGESGEVRLYYGSSHPSTLPDSVFIPVVPSLGYESDDRLGAAVALAGPIAGGTTSPILAGAPMGNNASGSLTGYVDLFTGRASPPVPVRLLRFDVRQTAAGAEMDWELEDAFLLSGLRLVTWRAGVETSLHSGWLDPGTRRFIDPNPPPGEMRYGLWGLDRSGGMLLLGFTSPTSPKPVGPQLVLGNNPCRETLSLRATLPAGWGRVFVIDAEGRETRRLWEGQGTGETLELRWDGRDSRGREAAPGIYFVLLRGGPAVLTEKVIKLPR